MRKTMILLTLVFMLAFGAGQRTIVYAGDINANEARVISYYNKTFYVNGKAYVASGAMKARANAKLMQDGIDLTAGEADNMIRQMAANVENGVKKGYLIPVGGQESGTSESTEKKTDADGEKSLQQETENNGGSRIDDANPDEIDEGTDKENQEKDSGKKSDAETSASEEGKEGASKSKKDSGKEKSEDDTRKTVDKKELAKELKEREDDKDKNALSITDNSGKKIKADDVTEKIRSGPVSIKDYTRGLFRVVDDEGTIHYESTLPIRDTGTEGDPWYLFPLILLVGILFVGIFCLVKPSVDIHWALGGTILAGIVIAAAAVGGRNTIASFVFDWKSAWISEAPEFAYQENRTTEVKPQRARAVLHQQYGLLRCVNIGLSAPMYYGDGDDELGKGVGIYPGYTLPGEVGTTLIGGHDGTFFAPLEHVSEGDVLELDTINAKRYYSVVDTAVADASDESRYAMQEKEDTLILYTCYPFGKATANRSRRLYVYAKEMDTGE